MNDAVSIDDTFIARLKKGDEKAFHQLYLQFAPAMKLVCRRYVNTDADAEDVFHEGFMKVYKNVANLKNHNLFIGWMKKIFINTALDHIKKATVKVSDCFVEIMESEYGEDELYNNDSLNYEEKIAGSDFDIIREVDFSQEEILETLMFIPENFRTVFQLFVIDKYTHQEISDLLMINEKTSKTRMYRARMYIKKELVKRAMCKLNVNTYDFKQNSILFEISEK